METLCASPSRPAGRLVALGSPTSSLSSAAPATGGVGQQLSAPSSPAAAPAASTPVDRLYSNGLFNPPADLQDDAPSSSPYANPATGQFVSKRPRRGAPLASPSKPSGELRKSALSPFRVRPRADSIAAGEEPDATPEPQPCCDALVEGLTAPPKDADRVYAYRHGSHGGDQPLQISEESCINPMALIAGEDWERFARHERPAASMSRFTGSAVSGSRRGSHSGGGTASSVRAAPARLRQPSDPGSYHAGSLISVSDAYLGARSQGQAPSCTGPLAASPASATPAKRSAAENGAFRALMTSPDASTAQEVARMIWGSGRKTASARPRSPARAIAAAPDECVSRPAHQLALARAGPDGGGQVGAGASSDGGSGVPAAWQPQAPSGLSGASCGRVTVADKDARVQRRLSGAHSATEPAAAASRQASESAEASQQPGDAAQGAATSPTAASISTMSGAPAPQPLVALAMPPRTLSVNSAAANELAHTAPLDESPGSWLVQGLLGPGSVHSDGFLSNFDIPEPPSSAEKLASRLPAAPAGDGVVAEAAAAAVGDVVCAASVSRLPRVSRIKAPQPAIEPVAALGPGVLDKAAAASMGEPEAGPPGGGLIDSCGGVSEAVESQTRAVAPVAALPLPTQSDEPGAVVPCRLADRAPKAVCDRALREGRSGLREDDAGLRLSLRDFVVARQEEVAGAAALAEGSPARHAPIVDIELAPPGGPGKHSPAGSTRLASPCSWMPQMESPNESARGLSPAASLGPFPKPLSLQRRLQEQPEPPKAIVAPSCPASPADAGAVRSGSPNKCVSPRIGKQLNLPAFELNASDATDGQCGLQRLPLQALQAAQSLLSCKSLPRLARTAASPAAPAPIRTKASSPSLGLRGSRSEPSSARCAEQSSVRFETGSARSVAAGVPGCSAALPVDALAVPGAGDAASCEPSGLEGTHADASAVLKAAESPSRALKKSRCKACAAGKQAAAQPASSQATPAWPSATRPAAMATSSPVLQGATTDCAVVGPASKLRSLTPALLQDEAGLSPMMAQQPLQGRDRTASAARPLQPQTSASIGDSGPRPASRRGVRSVHVTPSAPGSAVGPVSGCSERIAPFQFARLPTEQSPVPLPGRRSRFSPGLAASTPALRMIQECLRESQRAAPWVTPRFVAVEPQAQSALALWFEVVLCAVDVAGILLGMLIFAAMTLGKLSWWAFRTAVPDRQRQKTTALVAAACLAVLLTAWAACASYAMAQASRHGRAVPLTRTGAVSVGLGGQLRPEPCTHEHLAGAAESMAGTRAPAATFRGDEGLPRADELMLALVTGKASSAMETQPLNSQVGGVVDPDEASTSLSTSIEVGDYANGSSLMRISPDFHRDDAAWDEVVLDGDNSVDFDEENDDFELVDSAASGPAAPLPSVAVDLPPPARVVEAPTAIVAPAPLARVDASDEGAAQAPRRCSAQRTAYRRSSSPSRRRGVTGAVTSSEGADVRSTSRHVDALPPSLTPQWVWTLQQWTVLTAAVAAGTHLWTPLLGPALRSAELAFYGAVEQLVLYRRSRLLA